MRLAVRATVMRVLAEGEGEGVALKVRVRGRFRAA